jgi:hypothetical protein
VAKAALGQVFSEYFSFPSQSSFHQFLHHHNHLGAGTIGLLVPIVPSGPNWTPPPTIPIKLIWSEKLKGRHHLEELGTNERALKAHFNETGRKHVKWINLAHDRDQW